MESVPFSAKLLELIGGRVQMQEKRPLRNRRKRTLFQFMTISFQKV
jgi:hypothetical protein